MAYSKKMRILVIDDSSTTRRLIKDMLRQLGFNNVVTADDGMAALEVLNREKVDLIISDWNMPQMSGIELLRRVRADGQHTETHFLMVTAEAQQANIIEAVQAKVSNYIVKPFTLKTLQQKIERLF